MAGAAMAGLGRLFGLRGAAERLAGRLPGLMVAAERVAATVAQGVHGRRRTGMGETFWQFRPYREGDTLQRVDWRTTARSDRTYVRETEWEAAQTVWLWRDPSASMDWRSDRRLETKRDRAELIVIALALLLVRGGERLAAWGGRPQGGPAAIDGLMRWLEETGPDGPTGRTPAESLPMRESLPAEIALPRHAAAVLVGDFLSPPEALEARLVPLASRGVTAHLVQVLDPAELALPWRGRVRFSGLEGEGDELVPRVESLRAAYQDRLEARRAALALLCRRFGWTFRQHATDQPSEALLPALWTALATPTGPG